MAARHTRAAPNRGNASAAAANGVTRAWPNGGSLPKSIVPAATASRPPLQRASMFTPPGGTTSRSSAPWRGMFDGLSDRGGHGSSRPSGRRNGSPPKETRARSKGCAWLRNSAWTDSISDAVCNSSSTWSFRRWSCGISGAAKKLRVNRRPWQFGRNRFSSRPPGFRRYRVRHWA